MISALVTIREASAEDEAALCSTWCAAWGATFPAIDYQARWPAMWRRWRDMEAEIFVAMRGKSLIGMIVLGETEADTLLDQIALDPTEQGSGTAHLLMAFAKKRAAGPMRLTVNAFNARHPLLRARGFRAHRHRRQSELRPGDVRLRMAAIMLGTAGFPAGLSSCPMVAIEEPAGKPAVPGGPRSAGLLRLQIIFENFAGIASDIMHTKEVEGSDRVANISALTAFVAGRTVSSRPNLP